MSTEDVAMGSEEKVESPDQQEHLVCIRCHRGLKNPESRKLGYGPVCARHLKENRSMQEFDKSADR